MTFTAPLVRDTVSTVGPPHANAARLYAEADEILNEPELAELLRQAAAFLEFDQLEIIALRERLKVAR
jgi:hypothetical protein